MSWFLAPDVGNGRQVETVPLLIKVFESLTGPESASSSSTLRQGEFSESRNTDIIIEFDAGFGTMAAPDMPGSHGASTQANEDKSVSIWHSPTASISITQLRTSSWADDPWRPRAKMPPQPAKDLRQRYLKDHPTKYTSFGRQIISKPPFSRLSISIWDTLST
ncbi:uncharacterized protein FTOL_01994 [Fusarium torulosum]|uniref:Uncharacterized protein n=1 Tax=Fusarium torulosum TaxID=33205 RepID=A0AAE8M0Y9_9HYPO|nr:uncharacterized protein FTOL_01994 [Fusarium torulosum]